MSSNSKPIIRVMVSVSLGAFICAVLSAGIFSLSASLDGTQAEEVIAFAIVVGVVGLVIGTMIGLSSGIFNLGILISGIIGLLATAAVVAFYVLAFSRPGQAVHFLRESGIILIILGLPTTLTGILTALFRKVFFHA